MCSTAARMDSDRDGWIQINYEQFMKVRQLMLIYYAGLLISDEMTLSAP